MSDNLVLKNVVEAALLASGRALPVEELCTLFPDGGVDLRADVRVALQTLGEEYSTRGIELKEVASGFRIQIRGSVSEPVSRLWQERPAKYSRALLETLALVAYRQPITRGEIEQIRGVAVNPNIIKTLLERRWIRVVGHRDVPGKPELLGTTKEFLDYFSLQKLDDLPTLAELKQMEDLRVQLALPSAEVAVMDEVASGEASGVPVEHGAAADGGSAELDAGAEIDSNADMDAGGDSDASGDHDAAGEDESDSDRDDGDQRHPGLVARGPDDHS